MSSYSQTIIQNSKHGEQDESETQSVCSIKNLVQLKEPCSEELKTNYYKKQKNINY